MHRHLCLLCGDTLALLHALMNRSDQPRGLAAPLLRGFARPPLRGRLSGRLRGRLERGADFALSHLALPQKKHQELEEVNVAIAVEVRTPRKRL